MADRNDLVFKKIVNRVYTSPSKDWFGEVPGISFKLNAEDVWISDIPSTPPAVDTAVVKGYRKGVNELTLTQDITVNNYQGWYVEIEGNPAGSFISPRYGGEYTAKLYKNGIEIPVTDSLGWFFDYESGILTFDNSPGSGTYTIQAYRYTGKTVADIESSTGSSIWQGPVTSIVTSPPVGEPSIGDRYLIAHENAAGAFIGHEDDIAEWDGVEWQFIEISAEGTPGIITYVINQDRLYVYDNNEGWNWSGIDSVDLDYDNSDSELEATSVKGAIDEIVTKGLVYDETLACFITEPVRTIP